MRLGSRGGAAEHGHLAQRVGQVLLCAQHVRDVHQRVVHRDRKVLHPAPCISLSPTDPARCRAELARTAGVSGLAAVKARTGSAALSMAIKSEDAHCLRQLQQQSQTERSGGART